jgi:putative transposase
MPRRTTTAEMTYVTASTASATCGPPRNAIEQESAWRPGRGKMPRFAERCRQLTEARAANPWLAEGSIIVQQQAVRDHDQAMRNFFAGTHRRPTWRKAGRDEGFRIVAVKPGDVRRLNRNRAGVKIPNAGWVRLCVLNAKGSPV